MTFNILSIAVHAFVNKYAFYRTDIGEILFVPLVSWYQNGIYNPYGEMVERFFVKCEVRRVYMTRGGRMIEVYSVECDEEYTDLDEHWVRQWGQHRNLPTGCLELKRDHIELYEHQPHAVAADDSGDASVSDESILDAAADERRVAEQEIYEPEAPTNVEELLEGAGEAPAAQPFVQGLQGRGWLPGMLNRTPGDIVLCLVQQMVLHVVECANTKIVQENLNIEHITMGELLRFHGLRIFMCLFKLPSLGLYWRTDTEGPVRFPNFGRYLTLRRFREIKTALRFEDYSEPRPRDDKAWKVRSITEKMREAFRKLLPAPRREITIDEGMVRFTGTRCPIRRCLPNKPIPKGIKLFAAVDYSTGIMFDFFWDDSRLTAQNCSLYPWKMSGQVVLELVRDLPGTGYVIYTDNFYTSVPLARELIRRGHRLIGTLRQCRGVPVCVRLPSAKPTRACPRGTTRSSRTRDNAVHIHAWMDNAPCYFVDTVFGPEEEIVRRKVNGRATPFRVPKACSAYNKFMGGVDKFDQLRTGFYGMDMDGKATKWTIRAYEALFNFALANAYAVHRHMAQEADRESTHWDFMVSTANHLLCNVYLRAERIGRNAQPIIIPERAHTLVRRNPGTDTTQNAGNRRKRMNCKNCPNTKDGARNNGRRTDYYCTVCNVPLHPECEAEYHAKRLRQQEQPQRK